MNVKHLFPLCFSLLVGFTQATPTAEEMLKEINAFKVPKFDAGRRNDPAYRKQYNDLVEKAFAEHGKQIFDFYRLYPNNENTDKLMNQRWAALLGVTTATPTMAALDAGIADAESIFGSQSPPKIRQSAAYWKAYYQVMRDKDQPVKITGDVDGFLKTYPSDPRGADLLRSAGDLSANNSQKIGYYKRLLSEFKTSEAASEVTGILRRLEGVGKPVELSFADALTGKTVSLKDYRGKVVLLDFWATWCLPCIKEMPHLKELYSRLHNKGLEVIGISMDEPESKGGLTSLKKFVATNAIPWPQYYQGGSWSGPFSKSWGINSIPCLFVIDKQGNLVDVGAESDLDSLVTKLLK